MPKDSEPKTPKRDTEKRRYTTSLEVKLTEPELKTCSKQLAEALNAKARIESEIETFKAQKKAEITNLDGTIGKMTVLINSEKEYRPVDCEMTIDYDDKTKSSVRLDTGEVIRVEKLTADELQTTLI
jgi:flagellar motor switch protein FliM